MEQEAIKYVAKFYGVTEQEVRDYYWDEVVAYMSLIARIANAA